MPANMTFNNQQALSEEEKKPSQEYDAMRCGEECKRCTPSDRIHKCGYESSEGYN